MNPINLSAPRLTGRKKHFPIFTGGNALDIKKTTVQDTYLLFCSPPLRQPCPQGGGGAGDASVLPERNTPTRSCFHQN